jgi:putative transcriptional regulator
MIKYHDILERLAANGWPTTRLQREKQISNGTIIQIRAGRPITTSTIDTICRLCGCQPGDLISYVPDPEREGRG